MGECHADNDISWHVAGVSDWSRFTSWFKASVIGKSRSTPMPRVHLGACCNQLAATYAGPDDRAKPPDGDQTNRKTVLVHHPATPPCAAPADALSPTESRFASRLNWSFATQSRDQRTWLGPARSLKR